MTYRTSLQARFVVLALGSSYSALGWAQDADSERGDEESSRSEEEVHELDALVVEDQLVKRQQPAPSSVSQIDEEELNRYESDNIQQVLARVPGVQVRGEDGLGLRPNIGIRGTSANRSAKVTLLEDGVPLAPAPYAAPAAYYFPLVTRMHQVIVEKGGASLRWGPRAQGGMVNLKTAPIDNDWSALGDVAYGQFGYFKGHGRISYGTPTTGFLLEGVRIASSGFKELDGGGPTGFDKSEYMAKWRLNSSAEAQIYQQLEAKFGYSSEVSHETYVGLSEDDFETSPYRRYVATELDRMSWHRGLAQLRYTVLPSDNTEITVVAYRNQFTRDWFKLDGFEGTPIDEVLRNPQSPSGRVYYGVLTGRENSSNPAESLLLVDNYRWFISQGVRAQLAHDFSTGPIEHTFSSSLGFHYDEVNRRQVHKAYDMVGASSSELGHLQDKGESARLLASNRGQSYATTAHFVDEISWGKVTLTPGARLELVLSEFTDHKEPGLSNTMTQVGVTPGAGAHYALSENWGLLWGLYRGFGPSSPQPRPPTAPTPTAESSTTYEWGTRWSDSSFYFEALGYINDFQNLTGECSESRSCQAQDAGKQFDGGRVLVGGAELAAETRLNRGAFEFPLRATYTFTQSSFLSSFFSDNPEWGAVDRGDELPYLPKHQASLSLNATHKRWGELGVSSTMVSATREVAGSGKMDPVQRTDPYAIFNLNLRVNIIEQLGVYLLANNLFGARYLTSRRPHGARPGAPRWIQIGMKFEY